MEAIYDRYERRYSEPSEADGSDSSDWLGERATEMLADAAADEATGLFLELWSWRGTTTSPPRS